MKNLNVHVYEGKDKDSALKAVVENNEQPTINSNYQVPSDSGYLIVVVPNENADTELEFRFSVGAVINELVPESEKQKEYDTEETFFIFGIVFGALIVIGLVIALVWINRFPG